MTENTFEELRYWIEKTLERHETKLNLHDHQLQELRKIQDERTPIIQEFRDAQKEEKRRLTGAAVGGAGIGAVLLELVKYLVSLL